VEKWWIYWYISRLFFPFSFYICYVTIMDFVSINNEWSISTKETHYVCKWESVKRSILYLSITQCKSELKKLITLTTTFCPTFLFPDSSCSISDTDELWLEFYSFERNWFNAKLFFWKSTASSADDIIPPRSFLRTKSLAS
jgi:hypothetical protein